MKIVENANKYHIYNNITITDTLENNIYSVQKSMFGYYLQKEEDFKFPSKIYDVEKPFRDVVLKRFKEGDKNLGVLLSGTKGQGKSLTAKLLCKESNIPVILLTSRFDSDVFDFLRTIEQEYVLFVDEFEKLYPKGETRYDDNDNKLESKNSQNMWLPVMDGGIQFPNKVLFIFTVNDEVSEYLMNRPSRIRYNKKYNKLDKSLFDLIVEDKLENKEYVSDLEACVSLENLNVDTLISIIEDINMLNQSPSTFMSFFNYRTDSIKVVFNVMNPDTKEVLDSFITTTNHSFITSIPTYDTFYSEDKKRRYKLGKLVHVDKGQHLFLGESWDNEQRDKIINKIPSGEQKELPITKVLITVNEIFGSSLAF